MTYWLEIEEITEGCMPRFANPDDACFDLVAAERVSLKLGRVFPVPTGIKMGIPKGFEVQIRPRSGMAMKHGITVVNSPGTIDHGFDGEVMVLLMKIGLGNKDFVEIKDHNDPSGKKTDTHYKEYYTIEKGDRIAQACLKPVYKTVLEKVPQISYTGRGGLGHTGK